MPISLKHTTQAVGTDAGNGEIRKAQWNEEHTLTLATARLLGRTTSGTGAAEEISADASLTLSAGSLGLSSNQKTGAIGYTINGGGAVITTGIAGNGLVVPYNCTITGVTMQANTTGSIVVDIWKDTYANFPPSVADSICGSAKPTITSSNKSQNTTLTGWTTNVSAGDILNFNVDSVTSISNVVLTLTVTKT